MRKNEFNDFVYYVGMGQDITFSYNGKTYIIDGYHEKEGAPYILQTTQIIPFDPENSFSVSDLNEYNIKKFMKIKFFDGKSFSEIKDKAELVDV